MSNNTNQSYRWTRLPRPDFDGALPAAAATASPVPSNRKRDRCDDDGNDADGYHPYPDEDASDAQFGASYASLGMSSSTGVGSGSGAHRPTKRRRQTGPDLVAFDKPFPCAFRPCHYRATCTYHHGVPVPCDCDDPECPRGHAHRRRPQECDHGGTHQCRWNMLGECSFHHGIEESCDCDDVECWRAHPRRTKKNKEARKLLKKASKKTEKRKAKRKAKQEKKAKNAARKSHYRQWRNAQNTDETNQEKRRRYWELYPNGAPTTVPVKEEES